MNSKPMLGDHELSGVESIVSAETRSLAEHSVPGLAGSYLQDLGSEANTIVITGSMYGHEEEQAFLTDIREVFNRGDAVTFVADINTATDVTEVVIEEFDVAEVAASGDRFRYRIKIRKYIPPPEPETPSLLDDSLFDQAADLFEQAINAIDALTSVPDLADPTRPLREALSGVSAATGGLDDLVGQTQELISEGPPRPTAGEPPSGAPGAIEEETGEAVTPADLRLDPADPRVDATTGPTLQNMLQAPETADTASLLIGGIQNGTLAGVLGDDSDVAEQLAAAHGTEPSQLIPPGQDAALVLDAASPLEGLPTILVRSEARDDPARLAAALEEAGRTFALFEQGELAPCDSTPLAIPVPNLVPSTFCQVPAAVPVPGAGKIGLPEGVIEEEAEVIDPSAPDLRIDPTDPRIDVGAKFALKRMLQRPDMAADAARLIRGINGGTLAGIFGDDLGKAVEVARAHGTERWLLVPKGEDGVLVLDADLPLDAPPTVIFRGDTPDIREIPTRIDPALQKASRTFEHFQKGELGLCADSPAAIPVPNLVPPSFCRLPSNDLLVVVTEEETETGQPGPPVPGAEVRVEGPSPATTSTTQSTDVSGKALFPGLAPGSYEVTASKKGFEDASAQVLLTTKDEEQAPSLVAGANLASIGAAKGTVLLQITAKRLPKLIDVFYFGDEEQLPNGGIRRVLAVGETAKLEALGKPRGASFVWQAVTDHIEIIKKAAAKAQPNEITVRGLRAGDAFILTKYGIDAITVPITVVSVEFVGAVEPPLLNDLNKRPASDRVAHREFEVRLAPAGFWANRVVEWNEDTLVGTTQNVGSLPPQHNESLEQAGTFSFSRSSGSATSTMNSQGIVKVRVNLPPVGFNRSNLVVTSRDFPTVTAQVLYTVPAVVVIDAGHGGPPIPRVVGGSSFNNSTGVNSRVLEKDLVLDIATRVRRVLNAINGAFHINVMGRNADVNSSLAARSNVAGVNVADVFVSLHFNGDGRVPRGTETFVLRLGQPSRCLEPDSQGNLRNSNVPPNVNFDDDLALAVRVQNAVAAVLITRGGGAPASRASSAAPG